MPFGVPEEKAKSDAPFWLHGDLDDKRGDIPALLEPLPTFAAHASEYIHASDESEVVVREGALNGLAVFPKAEQNREESCHTNPILIPFKANFPSLLFSTMPLHPVTVKS